MNFNTFYFF